MQPGGDCHLLSQLRARSTSNPPKSISLRTLAKMIAKVVKKFIEVPLDISVCEYVLIPPSTCKGKTSILSTTIGRPGPLVSSSKTYTSVCLAKKSLGLVLRLDCYERIQSCMIFLRPRFQIRQGMTICKIPPLGLTGWSQQVVKFRN